MANAFFSSRSDDQKSDRQSIRITAMIINLLKIIEESNERTIKAQSGFITK
jgi:hypothetical protein